MVLFNTLVGVVVGAVVALFVALFRGLVLFWPVMLIIGALHAHLPVVPPLSWEASFFLVAALALLIPTATSTVKEN